MICISIVVDESVSIIGKKGKKKLRECNLHMTLTDPYTFICPVGHLRKTQQYDEKGRFK